MNEIEVIDHADPTEWAWRRLLALADPERAEARIRERFDLGPSKQRENVQKQAKQIRYCLLQAREYFLAASAVGPATRANLLYYGITSLAFSLILLKNTGEYSFDRRRSLGQKGHHGLDLSGYPFGSAIEQAAAAKSLTAKPHQRKAVPAGTFADLLAVLEPEPILCKRNLYRPSSVEYGLYVLSSNKVVSIGDIAEDTYSLATLIASIPELHELAKLCETNWALGSCEISDHTWEQNGHRRLTFTINNSQSANHSLLLDSIRWENLDPAQATDAVSGDVLEDAVLFRFTGPRQWPSPTLPSGAHERGGLLRLFSGRESGTCALPPLAAAYGILFILSMLVRYYPDLWMRAIEARGGFYFLVEEVLDMLAADVPLMLLDQILSTKHVRRSFHSHVEVEPDSSLLRF